MPKCSVCGKTYEIWKGLTYVTLARIYHFCSRKCRRAWEMKRRKLRWAKERKASGKNK